MANAKTATTNKNIIGKSMKYGLLGAIAVLAGMFIWTTMFEHGTFTFDSSVISNVLITFVAVTISSWPYCRAAAIANMER